MPKLYILYLSHATKKKNEQIYDEPEQKFSEEKYINCDQSPSGSTAQMLNWIRNESVRPVNIRKYTPRSMFPFVGRVANIPVVGLR